MHIVNTFSVQQVDGVPMEIQKWRRKQLQKSVGNAEKIMMVKWMVPAQNTALLLERVRVDSCAQKTGAQIVLKTTSVELTAHDANF